MASCHAWLVMLSPSTTDSAIGALFRAALQGHPDTCFLRSPAAAFSYAECYRRCWSLARHLNQLPGQRLASFEVDSPSRVLLLLACALSNKSLLLFNADHSADQVREQAEALAVDLLITDSETLLQDAQLQEASGQTELPGDTHLESELLILSSGTTGSPKCVRYQWRDLVAQIPKSDSLHPQVWLLANVGRANSKGTQVLLPGRGTDIGSLRSTFVHRKYTRYTLIFHIRPRWLQKYEVNSLTTCFKTNYGNQ